MAMDELKAEMEKLKADNERLRAGKQAADEPVTLDSLSRRLDTFMEKTDHAFHHRVADEIGDEVHALSEAENKLSPQQITDARSTFEMYDTDSSGAIDAEQLLDLMRALGEAPEPDALQKMIEEVDDNQNGVIDFPEFLTLYAMLAGDMKGEHVKKVKLSSTSFYGRVALIRWIKNDADAINGDVTGPLVPGFRSAARSLALSRPAEMFFYFCIGVAGVCSGIQTYDGWEEAPAIIGLEVLTLLIFAVEVVTKMLAESAGKPASFFDDPWNVFDFGVLLGLLVLTPMGEGEMAVVRILRMLRAVRVLRAAKVLPKLTLVLETLIRSASSVMYIAMFLMLVMYIFAIVGVSIFNKNDPWHFGDLGTGMLSLWRISTLEDWTDIMYFNQFGVSATSLCR